MTDALTTALESSTALSSDSRTIDDSASTNALGRGIHLPEGEQKQEESKPLSTRDAIAKAFDDNQKAVEEKAKGAVDQAKVKLEEAEAKPAKAEQPRESGKFAKADTQVDAKADKGAAEQPASERASPVDRESETRRHQEPPARFLPEAREKWANVPSNIKAEFHRVSQEMEAETSKYRESHERYEAIRQFDDQAKASGTDLKTALQSYTNIENLLRSNPARGVAEVLRNIGLTPEQYAQHVMQNPHAHQFQQQPQQPAPPQQQSNPEIEALRNEIHSMKAQAIIPVIDRFIEEHPDYHALENQIEAILKSGVIEQIYGSGLSPEQKLAQSYRMAGGRAPSQSVAQQEQPAPIQNQAAARPVDLDGQKSIKGAPTNGQSTEPAKRFKSNRAALEEAFNAFGGR